MCAEAEGLSIYISYPSREDDYFWSCKVYVSKYLSEPKKIYGYSRCQSVLLARDFILNLVLGEDGASQPHEINICKDLKKAVSRFIEQNEYSEE
jgi:hypothetical protein